MTRPGPKRKYKNIARTTLSTEQWRYDCVELMRKFNPTISHSYVYNEGFKKVFQSFKQQASPERSLVIEKVRAEKRLELEELQQQLQELDIICGDELVGSNHTNYSIKRQYEEEKRELVILDHTYYEEKGMIEVEDLEDKTRMWIPKEDFNPEFEKKIEPVGADADE